MDLLQEFIFIPLDVFHSIMHNDGMKIDNKEATWLTFLSEDSPKAIVRLIKSYPEFKEMYNDIYKLCRNMEWIMGIFSEELRILDRNTVQLMIDDMQEALDSQKEELMTKMEAIEQQREVLAEKEGTIEQQREVLAEKEGTIEQQNQTIADQKATIIRQERELSEIRAEIERLKMHSK